MAKQFTLLFVFILLVFQLLFTEDLLSEDFDGVAIPKQTLVIGKITANPKKIHSYLKPMVEYMAARMGDLGILRGEVLMAKNTEQMRRYILSGRVDWVTETAYAALLLEKEANAEILLRKWKKGVPTYHSIFVTRKDSAIYTLDDLVGRVIVFEDSDSNSAFFLPALALVQRELNLKKMKDYRQIPPVSDVGFVLSHSELNSSFWLERGKVHAAAISNLDWEKDDHLKKSMKKNLRIFHRTPEVPRALELVRKDLDVRVKNRLRDVLLQIHNDPTAINVLESYQKTEKFDILDQNDLAVLGQMRTHMESIRKNYQ